MIRGLSSAFSKIAEKLSRAHKKVEEFNAACDKNHSYESKIEKLKLQLVEEYKIWKLKPKSKYYHKIKNVEDDIELVRNFSNKKSFTTKEKLHIDTLGKKYNLW